MTFLCYESLIRSLPADLRHHTGNIQPYDTIRGDITSKHSFQDQYGYEQRQVRKIYVHGIHHFIRNKKCDDKPTIKIQMGE